MMQGKEKKNSSSTPKLQLRIERGTHISASIKQCKTL